jgi:hypothetical protein
MPPEAQERRLIVENTPSRRVALRLPRLRAVDLWVLGALVLAALVTIAAQGAVMVQAIYLNADSASAPFISSLLEIGGHSTVTLGNYPWYESMWVMLATRWLPFHRSLWLVGPFLAAAAAAAMLTWSAWRVFGLRAALLVLTPLVCVSYGMREILFAPDWHGAAVFHACLLGTGLVFFALWWDRLSLRARVLGGVFLALVTAAGETDRLLVATGLVPFMLAPTALWLRSRSQHDREVAIFAVCVGVGAILLGEFATAAMRYERIVSSQYRPGPTHDLGHNATLLLNGITFLAGDAAGEQPKSTFGLLSLLVALAAIAVAAGLYATYRRRGSGARPSEPGVPIYATYWALVVACTSVAFLVSNAPTDILSARYLAAGFIAIFALLPLIAAIGPRAQRLVLAGVVLYAAVALARMESVPITGYGTGPEPATARAIQRYVTGYGANTGFANYQDAAVLSWETNMRLRVYPIRQCPMGVGYCPYILHIDSAWYEPRDRRRSFVIADTEPGLFTLDVNTQPLGRPLATRSFGHLTVYVYAGDLASVMRLG